MCEHSYNMNTPLAIIIISHPRCAGYREIAPHSTGINQEWKDCTFQCACLKPQHWWVEEIHSLGILHVPDMFSQLGATLTKYWR